jgi:hypothetical protein
MIQIILFIAVSAIVGLCAAVLLEDFIRRNF